MAFKDVVGNERIKRILKLALERGRVPNSLLFCGPEGVGKKAMALTLAKTLNCLNLTTDSCDECPSCEAIDKGVHPDVMVIAAEKQEIKIEQTRFLKQMAYLRPMTGKKRVFIVVDASEMSDPAANSLLKVLEEPPPYAHLILVTASPFLLFPTILSRDRPRGDREDPPRAEFWHGAGPDPRPPRRREPRLGPGPRMGGSSEP
jgi:DNA polymerase III delta' subunit